MDQQHTFASWRTVLVVAVMVALAMFALTQQMRSTNQPSADTLLAPASQAPALDQSSADASADAPDDLFPVYINRPATPPALVTDRLDVNGNPVTINCSTCHSIKAPNFQNRATADLDEFHQNLTYNHGELTCLSCHNPNDYDTLRLADGSTLPYRDVMTLCGQCHGPQLRDYNQGVHGGMTGYWDRTRGPQYRNGCIDCHDPHAPAFPLMRPNFKPIDRFLNPHASNAHSEDDHDE